MPDAVPQSSDENDIIRATQNSLVKKYFIKPLNQSMLNELMNIRFGSTDMLS